jgi:NADH:ubiquinone oxidoreductase subunit C
MFGIEIRGRDAKRLLLEKWDGKEFPLRKSFRWNADYKSD